MKPMTRGATFLAVLLAAFGVCGCGDYAVPLPNGYSLVSVYAGAVSISHPAKGVVIDANVDGYTVIGGVVVGHVAVAELPPEKAFSKPGYFIVDTRTGEVQQALGKDTWLRSLKALHIAGEPDLRKPSRFDRW